MNPISTLPKVEFIPSSPQRAIDQTRGALTVVAIGALCGAVVGAGVAGAAFLAARDLDLWLLLVMFAASIGALLGGTVGPIVAWALLRTVPMWAIIAWTSVGTIAGFEVALATTTTGAWVIASPLLGFFVSAVALHVLHRRGQTPGSGRAVAFAGLLLVGGDVVAGRLQDRLIVRSILNLNHLPSSVRVRGCRSEGFMDPQTVCSLTFAPTDLAALRAGRRFSASSMVGELAAHAEGELWIRMQVDSSQSACTLIW